MDDLKKVSSLQLYEFWKNLSIGLLMVIAMLTFSQLLPFYLSPVLSLGSAAILSTLLYNNRQKKSGSCMLPIYALFFCFISFSFITIILNVLYAWGLLSMPMEFIFFNDPYIPSLMMMPISFLTLLVINVRRHKLRICIDCKLERGDNYERGKLGSILDYESHFQLKNLLLLFGILSVIIWTYYLVFYININQNARDWYVFTWLIIIMFILDELYFVARYYNLYLDLKENDEIISPQELRDMTAKTYLRFYVVCGNNMYVDTHAVDAHESHKEIIDTPFFTKRSVNGITVHEVKRIITRMTGVNHGELRFFFGRKSNDMSKHSLLRYFYFLDGTPDDYPELNTEGEWMKFDTIKHIYSTSPSRLSNITVADLTRLATIILTEKIFDEEGRRKSRIKSYNPTFNLDDVRKSELDFQDDKWLKISMFNSDTRMYGLKRWWRNITGRSTRKTRTWR